MKKTLSVILVFCLLFSLVIPVSARGLQNQYPVITIGGRGSKWEYVNADGEKIYPNDLNTDDIITAVEDCLPLLGKGMITGNYQPWIDAVIDCITPYYEKMIPDKDGNITDGSHPVLITTGGGNTISLR